jgi:hypothetical protein
MHEDVQWQPLSQLDYVLGIVRGMTEETRDQRRLYQEPGVTSLDPETVGRIRAAYSDRLDLIELFRKQHQRWQKEKLNAEQAGKLMELKALLDEDERLSREIQRLFGGGTANTRGQGSHN